MSRFTESGLCSELLAMGKIVLCNGGKIGVVLFSVTDSFTDLSFSFFTI